MVVILRKLFVRDEDPVRGELLVRNRYVLLADLALIGASAFIAFALRFDLGFVPNRPEFFPYLVAALAIKPIVLFFFGMYRRFWRYASLNDMLALGLAVSTASLVLAVASGVARSLDVVPTFSRAVLLIDWLLSAVALASVRVAVRILGETRVRARVYRRADLNGDSGHKKRVLVLGAGEAGAMVVREMQRNPQIGMAPVGFLDDDERKHGKRIYGTLVMGAMSAFERVAKVARIEEVIIAMPRASGAVVRVLAERCHALELRCRTIPGVFELLDGQVSISRLRQIEIGDLLRRSQIDLTPGADAYLEGRTVLITGAGGSVGSELCRQVARARPRTLILLGHGENSIFDVHGEMQRVFPGAHSVPVIADIRDENRMMRLMEHHRPDVVFHAAAHKHVPLMEENPDEAAANNVLGTLNIVNAAARYGVDRLVLISTDKAVSPTSIMGASKRMAELIVMAGARRHGRAFAAVRFGNVLDSRGSVVPVLKKQIERGGPITITHPDMKRFFMTTPEAVHLVLQAGGMARGGELFALKMGEPLKIVDLAADLVRLSGFSAEEIRVVFTGMRAGEKLAETLWEPGARVEPTAHAEVLRIVEPDGVEWAELTQGLRRLAEAIANGDALTIHAVLADYIPTFLPARFPETVPTPTDS